MQTLLIVLLIGCALLTVVHIGRGVWARSRSVERHQQALHTLATFTAPLQGTPGAHAGTGDHQAHVRVIGRNSPAGAGAPSTLPPPREVTLPGPVRTSPFRRPSHLDPSVAALDAVATSPVISARALPWVRRGSPPPPPRQRRDGDGEDATLPGMPPVRAGDGPLPGPCPSSSPRSFTSRTLSPATRRDRSRRLRGGPAPAPGLPRRARCCRLPTGGQGPNGGRGGQRGPFPAVAGPAAPGDSGGLGSGGGRGPRRRARPPRAPGPRRFAYQLAAPAPRRPGAVYDDLGAGPHHNGRPTASTVPPEPAVLVSANAARPPTSSPRHGLNSGQGHGPCWIEVKAGSPAGQVVVEETLSAGQRSSVTGPAWIRLGDRPMWR